MSVGEAGTEVCHGARSGVTRNGASYNIKSVGGEAVSCPIEKYAEAGSCHLEMSATKSYDYRTSAEAESCAIEKSAATGIVVNLPQGESRTWPRAGQGGRGAIMDLVAIEDQVALFNDQVALFNDQKLPSTEGSNFTEDAYVDDGVAKKLMLCTAKDNGLDVEKLLPLDVKEVLLVTEVQDNEEQAKNSIEKYYDYYAKDVKEKDFARMEAEKPPMQEGYVKLMLPTAVLDVKEAQDSITPPGPLPVPSDSGTSIVA